MSRQSRIPQRRDVRATTDAGNRRHQSRHPELEFHPLADIFPLMEGAEFDDLVADIKVKGLCEPIVLYENKTLDGRNRYLACIAAGIEPTFKTYEGTDPVAFVISANLCRRHLTESQRAMIAAKLATFGRGRPSENASIEAISQDDAADMLKVSRSSVQRSRTVFDHGVPELVRAVKQGEVSVSAAANVATLPRAEQRALLAKCDQREIARAYKENRARKYQARYDERIKKIVAASNNDAPLPTDRRYPVLLADPAWAFRDGTADPSRRIEKNHYGTLSTEQICALPVKDLAAPDAILFLWVPSSHQAEAFLRVLPAWGFEGESDIVWVKTNGIGMGHRVRNRHERLLICTRGNMPHPPPSARPDSVIEAPRREHSRKPDEVCGLIERMYPDLPRIELFARQVRPGWAAWGNEIEQVGFDGAGVKRLRER